MKLTLEEAKKIMSENNGNLNLGYTLIKELPDNLTVVGYLDLSGTSIEKLPDGLSVGGDLGLSYTSIKELPDNLTVGGNFDLRGTPIEKLPDNLTVVGYLDLRGTPIEKLPDGLSVGGDLGLSYTSIKELPDNLTVGGNFYLYDTEIEKLPDNLTVGGEIIGYEGDTSNVHYLKDGDCVPNQYIYADNILTFVESKKEIKGYTYYKGKIAGRNVISDGTHFAHCTSFKEGVKELDFKKAKDRGAEQYSNLTLDTVVSTKELITMYRVITGACQQGTKHFVDSLGEKLKDSYTIREAIDLTNGQYGARVFEEFFK